MTLSNLQRRSFVAALGAFVMPTALGAKLYCPDRIADPHFILARRLLSILPNRESALKVGRLVGAEKKLSGGLVWFAEWATFTFRANPHSLVQLSDEELRLHLLQRIREDFRVGRIVVIGGWRLSETEAALAEFVCTINLDCEVLVES